MMTDDVVVNLLVPQVLTPAEVLNLRFNLREFMQKTNTEEVCIKFAAKLGLIANEIECIRCKMSMRVVKPSESSSKTKKGLLYWTCSCKRRVSIFKNSIFENAHLSLKQVLEIIYMWSREFPPRFVVRETGVPKRTVVEYYAFIRDICAYYCNYINETPRIGGYGSNGHESNIVELERCKLFERSKNDQGWVLAGVERNSGNFFLARLARKDAESVVPLVQRYVLPETQIISKDWKALTSLDETADGYEHFVVSNQDGFVDDLDSNVNTCTVESLLKDVRKRLKSIHNNCDQAYETYLSEYFWRESFGDVEDHFACIVLTIRAVYAF